LHFLELAVLGKKARVARRFCAAQIEHHQLCIEADRGARDERLALPDARPVERLPRGEIIRAVEDDIDVDCEGFHCRRVEPLRQRYYRDLRVKGNQGIPGSLDLACADRRGAVENLALQVGEIDLVRIGEGQASEPGGSEVQGRRTAQAARADNQRG
jgi:hypothetical protein